MWNKSKIDLEQLALEIRNLKPTQKMYKVLRDELTRLDHWKQRKRWSPQGFSKRHEKDV